MFIEYLNPIASSFLNFSKIIFKLLTIILIISNQNNATQSIFSCPLNPTSISGIPGVFPDYGPAGGIGEVCGDGSFIHYWTCCENYPFECCFNLQTWAIVLLAMLVVIFFVIILCFVGRYLISRQREEEIE
uniref:Candidate secreted effector n=1 Tax=Meloidogyne incognita TaxID=6306 RepID=A0A914MH87_MELIC